MPSFVVLDAATDEELGRASYYDNEIEGSGAATLMIRGRVSSGETEEEAFDFFASGWSNGYVLTEPLPDEAPPRVRASRALNQAPVDDPDLVRVQAQWEQALQQLLAEWRQITAAQRAEIMRQVEAAIEDDDLEALSEMDVSTETAAAVLLAALLAMYGVAATQMAAEMAALGVPVAAAAAGAEVLGAVAGTVAQLLAAGLVHVAAQAALRAWRPGVKAAQVVAAVIKALEGLSDRPLRDQLGGALSRVQNMGRLETARDYEDSLAPDQVSQVIYFSKETLDRNTCWACNNIDGTEYNSWIEAWVDYGGGIYRGCEGGLRCRGTIKARWNPEAGA